MAAVKPAVLLHEGDEKMNSNRKANHLLLKGFLQSDNGCALRIMTYEIGLG